MKRILFLSLCFLPATVLAQTPVHQNVLTWAASGSTGATYNVYKSPTCTGTYTKLASNLTALSYTDSGMTDGAVNCYYVTAIATGAGESGQSNSLRCVTPTSTPAPPVTLPPGTAASTSQ